MSVAPFDLARLLQPLTPADFFRSYWEQRPLHLSRVDSGYYHELLQIGDVERLIASPDARYPAIQLSRDGVYFPKEVYCDDLKFGAETFTGVPNVQKVTAEYRAGATVVLPALHRTWAPLRMSCASIEAELDHVVHANAYLTPGNTAGFAPHYDTHDVLVLQLSGKKHWRIYPPPIELPHRKQPFNPAGYVLPPQPLLEVDLEPGDLLYLPRGFIHTTTTSSQHSAHVTLGIAVYTWLDLAGEALQAAMGSVALRKALPAGFARQDELPELRRRLREILRHVGQQEEGPLIEAFLSRMRSTPESASRDFQADVVVIAQDTVLEAPSGSTYRLVAQGNRVALEYQSRRFLIPAEAGPLIEFMRERRRFRTVELPTALGMEVKLALVRSLQEKGFLTVARLGNVTSEHHG